jgi:hypothetical protein
MWQTIVRHPDAFYPARGLFSHQIINSLSKLALATNRRVGAVCVGAVCVGAVLGAVFKGGSGADGCQAHIETGSP